MRFFLFERNTLRNDCVLWPFAVNHAHYWIINLLCSGVSSWNAIYLSNLSFLTWTRLISVQIIYFSLNKSNSFKIMNHMKFSTIWMFFFFYIWSLFLECMYIFSVLNPIRLTTEQHYALIVCVLKMHEIIATD